MCAGIGSREFGRQVRKVSECELARVGFVADAEKADRILDHVAGKGEVNRILMLCLLCRPHCRVYWPDSILACCSEFLFSRLKIIFACDLTSASSDSTCREVNISRKELLPCPGESAYLFIVDGCSEHKAWISTRSAVFATPP